MNSYDRIYNILIEGLSTGASPTQTGIRVGAAVAKLKAKGEYTHRKKEQVADIGTRVADRQGRMHSADLRQAARSADAMKDSEDHAEVTRGADRKQTKAALGARRRYDAHRRLASMLSLTPRNMGDK